jgi:hypothetical protein
VATDSSAVLPTQIRVKSLNGFRPANRVTKSTAIISLALFAAAFGTGCNSDRIDKLEAENKDIVQKLQKLQSGQLLEAKAKCAQAAKEYFREEWTGTQSAKETRFLDYTTHYSEPLNQCSVLIEQHLGVNPNSPTFDLILVLTDVYERREDGRFQEGHVYVEGNSEAQPTMYHCSVGTTECKSLQEFTRLIEPYTDK